MVESRTILIRYSTDTGESDTFEKVSFPRGCSDNDIDLYCYDVIETEYANQRWFDWHELREEN